YTFIDTDQDQEYFFWTTMLFSSISSFASSGLIGAGIQGLAAAYSASYVRVVMIASAVAGMGTSLLSIVCQATTDNAVLNGRIYFGIAFVWTIISIFCYLYLVTSSQEKESVEMDSDPIVHDNDDEDEEESVDAPGNNSRCRKLASGRFNIAHRRLGNDHEAVWRGHGVHNVHHSRVVFRFPRSRVAS
ncbi:hypothetical protein PRIPAC_80576, partial [Pristionchus pacificus]